MNARATCIFMPNIMDEMLELDTGDMPVSTISTGGEEIICGRLVGPDAVLGEPYA